MPAHDPGLVTGPRDRGGLVTGPRDRGGLVTGPRDRGGLVTGPRDRGGLVTGPRDRGGLVTGPRDRGGLVTGPRDRGKQLRARTAGARASPTTTVMFYYLKFVRARSGLVGPGDSRGCTGWRGVSCVPCGRLICAI